MYFNALLNGLADMPPTDEATRFAIEQEAEQKGWPAMHEALAAIDPEYAQHIHPNHSHRIVRALAVYRISGKTMSHFRQLQAASNASGAVGFADRYQLVQLSLMPLDRPWLHQRIERRYQLMLEKGFVAEVEQLYQRGDLNVDMPSMRSVGYRQVWQYLAGEYDYQTMVEKGIVATRQLAKRQMTWLRGWPELQQVEIHAESTTLGINNEKILNKALNFLPIQSI